ncbi:MAG: alanine-zipper protein [Nitrospirota bacterium]
MKKVFLPALIVLFLFSSGCASRDYVRQQIEPLVERISKLEAKVSSMGPCQTEETKKTSQDCCDKADAAAKRAEDAANRAEDAAKKAGAAAEKSKKAFELQQTK